MSAMRFVYSRPFVGTVIAGMFDDRWLTDNYRALQTFRLRSAEQAAALEAAKAYARALESSWLPEHYRWLEEQWRA